VTVILKRQTSAGIDVDDDDNDFKAHCTRAKNLHLLN